MFRNSGIPQGTLNRWGSEYRKDPKNSFPGIGKRKAAVVTIDPSLLSLKQKIEELRLVRDILKKSLAHCIKGPCEKYAIIGQLKNMYRIGDMCRVFCPS